MLISGLSKNAFQTSANKFNKRVIYRATIKEPEKYVSAKVVYHIYPDMLVSIFGDYRHGIYYLT